MQKNKLTGLMAGAAVAAVFSIATVASGEPKSGYLSAEPETQAMQDDDFSNPAMLITDYGGELWSTPDGEVNKSCEDCHGDADESMKGVKTRYPAYYEAWGKMINIELRVNECRKDNQKAKPWKYESKEMQGMASYIGYQSRGLPMAVDIGGKATPFFKKGKEFYYQRRGQMDMACSHCHEDNAGNMIRANLLTEGQTNGFPTYRLKWQGVGTLHRRFAGCNKNIRANPYKRGAEEYVNLELYLAWRGRGLSVETPSVRN
jgi:sulfur-oxidizing protein SoxA